MIKAVLNKIVMLLYYKVGALILEAVTFSFLGLGAWPEYSALNFAIIIFVALLVFAIPNYTAQYVVYTIILALQSILIYVNYSLFRVFLDVVIFYILTFICLILIDYADKITSLFIEYKELEK